MDQLNCHRDLVKRYLSAFAELVNRNPARGVEMLCAFDDERGTYVLLKTGWNRGRRVHGTTVFARIRDGKVWVEEDWTEEGLANGLVKAGVPAEDIVLAFQPPSMRPLTEFATA